MHIVSMTQTIIADSDKAVLRRGNAALPARPDFPHPPGSVLEVDDEEARSLIARGLVERYDRKVHGDDPERKAARFAGVPSVQVAAPDPEEEPRRIHRLAAVPAFDPWTSTNRSR